MSELEIYPRSSEWKAQANVTEDQYKELYKNSVENPEEFWAQQSEQIHWMHPFNKVKNTSFKKPIQVNWFEGGKLNLSYNCLDRHLDKNGDKVAFYWEPDNPNNPGQSVTYKMFYERVCQFANVLKEQGVKKGDRVTIYSPMIPETLYCMQACARIGAIHSVIFAGFSPEAIAVRIKDCDSEFVITADESRRGGKTHPLKTNMDKALEKSPGVKKCFVIKSTGGDIQWNKDLDVDLIEAANKAPKECSPEPMKSEDPLFILYTSGSTGQPKGVFHKTGGYSVYTASTFKNIFDYKESDIYWCAADVGWITGHSYICYSPFANGATQVVFEGVPTFPDCSRLWQIVDKYKVTTLYTAPTLIRALMAEGNTPLQSTTRESLRLLGSVGEPINPEAWRWYFNEAGKGKCPIVDTWWQTETGGILLTPLAGVNDLKPGAAMQPYFGIQPALLNEKGEEIKGEGEGLLVLKDSWPGQMAGVYGDPDRFYQTYFSQYDGYYFTGDGAKRDKQGHYWVTGRVDDVLNISGHRIGTAEVESSLVGYEGVAECAAVGIEHPITGQALVVFVVMEGSSDDPDLENTLKKHVAEDIGPFAKPHKILIVPGLPKTRSGKIMRRIVRKIADGQSDQLGDISTLANPEIVEGLISQYKKGL